MRNGNTKDSPRKSAGCSSGMASLDSSALVAGILTEREVTPPVHRGGFPPSSLVRELPQTSSIPTYFIAPPQQLEKIPGLIWLYIDHENVNDNKI